jgi:photosystem II stability/assembly factor-like uncharacterized protein
MSELSRRGAVLIEHPAMAPPPVAVVAGRARRYRVRRRLRAGVAACALVAVVAGGLAWRSAGSVAAPQPWAAAGPAGMLPAPAVAAVPAGPAPAHAPAGTWRLASYLGEPASWGRNNQGPAAGGYLSCPQAGTCYYAGAPGGGSSSGPGLGFSILYVSHDGGLSWTAVSMTGGASFTTALTCPTARDCLAGGKVSGQAVLLATGDGGLHWSYRALPDGDGVINQLACPTLESCRALATQSAEPSFSGSTTPRAWFLRTDDAGAHWSAESFPARDTIGALSCPSAADCVAVGSGIGRESADGDPPGVVLRTIDGGRAWAPGVLPSGMSFLPFAVASVTCAGTSTCYALGNQPERYHPSDTAHGEICVANPPDPTVPGGVGCKPPAYVEGGAIAVSSDGGATWRMLALPPRTPEAGLYDISCPTARACWIAGEQAVPQNTSAGSNGSSAMILGTMDGGASWSKSTFAAGRLASGQQADSLMAVGEIACPAVNSCVGIGIADQGSYHTPVYTNAGG